jgi:putative transposase
VGFWVISGAFMLTTGNDMARHASMPSYGPRATPADRAGMRQRGIRARAPRRYRACTTESKHSLPVAANLLDQNFVADQPNQVWLADISYIAIGEGWLYLAVILDLFTRKVVGWAMRDHMRA